MWLWKRRERFSIDELRFLTEQLQRTTYVNDYNKDSVVETLRSIAELMIWGDKRDPSFFEHFMEKQVMVLFLQILELSSSTTAVAVQLLQSVSIMIQNIRSDHAIYYIFSNGYLNHFITFPFDFRDEELLAYYISFLRTTSTKLDQTTISFFITTENDKIVSFPLYTEGIKFFRHEESMVRIAVRTLTLNVYHVNDKCVREFVTSERVVGYISDLVQFLKEKSSSLHNLVASAERTPDSVQSVARLEGSIAETEEILDYCNDIVFAGIPDLARVMTESLMHLFVVPLLSTLSSWSSLCSLYLLFRILYTIRHKPLANGIAAALLCEDVDDSDATPSCPMETILNNLVSGNDMVIAITVALLLCLLHSEVDESILDALGLLPRRKQHRRRLLQTLMGSNSDEDLLFASSPQSPGEDRVYACDYSSLLIQSERNMAGKKLTLCKENEEQTCKARCVRMQDLVVKRLLELVYRRPPVDILWKCVVLFSQIFPHHQEESIQRERLDMIHVPYTKAKETLFKELDDCWCDLVPSVLCETWENFRTAVECSESVQEAKPLLLPHKKTSEDRHSSTAVAQRMQASSQAFVALHQLHQLLTGAPMSEAPPLDLKLDHEDSTIKVGTELDLSTSPELNPSHTSDLMPSGLHSCSASEQALSCRVAFEKGREEKVLLMVVVKGFSGWLMLVHELTSRPGWGSVRIVAPLAGCLPEIDEKHAKWLHLRIRPPKLPEVESSEGFAASKSSRSSRRIDGRWTLAFPEADGCKLAMEFVQKNLLAQKNAVERVLEPLLSFTKV